MTFSSIYMFFFDMSKTWYEPSSLGINFPQCYAALTDSWTATEKRAEL